MIPARKRSNDGVDSFSSGSRSRYRPRAKCSSRKRGGPVSRPATVTVAMSKRVPSDGRAVPTRVMSTPSGTTFWVTLSSPSG